MLLSLGTGGTVIGRAKGLLVNSVARGDISGSSNDDVEEGLGCAAPGGGKVFRRVVRFASILAWSA